MGKINIGGELNSIFGRVAAAEQIYDYANNRTQERINTMVLNELYSFDLGLKIVTTVNGIDGLTDMVEYTGVPINAEIRWDITRKHGFEFVLDKTTCPDGLLLSIDNTENSTLTELDAYGMWGKSGETKLKAGLGITTATMVLDMVENFHAEQQAKFYLLPPIYYGFFAEENVGNPSMIDGFEKLLSKDGKGRYTMINETGNPAYFYICIPHTLGVSEIEVYSSGFKVPFIKVLNENTPSSGLDLYDCWRNPTGSMIWNNSEIVYDVN